MVLLDKETIIFLSYLTTPKQDVSSVDFAIKRLSFLSREAIMSKQSVFKYERAISSP